MMPKILHCCSYKVPEGTYTSHHIVHSCSIGLVYWWILLNSFNFQMEYINSPFGLMNLFFICFPIYSSSLVFVVHSLAPLRHDHGFPVLFTIPVKSPLVEDIQSPCSWKKCHLVLFHLISIWIYWIHLRFWYEKRS